MRSEQHWTHSVPCQRLPASCSAQYSAAYCPVQHGIHTITSVIQYSLYHCVTHHHHQHTLYSAAYCPAQRGIHTISSPVQSLITVSHIITSTHSILCSILPCTARHSHTALYSTAFTFTPSVVQYSPLSLCHTITSTHFQSLTHIIVVALVIHTSSSRSLSVST